MKETLLFVFIALRIFCEAYIYEDAESMRTVFSSINFDFALHPNSSSKECNQQVVIIQESLDRNELWARKLRDSWGSLPSGIFSGNVFDFGNFDQCIKFEYQTVEAGRILGQHCTLRIPIEREPTTMAKITTPSRT